MKVPRAGKSPWCEVEFVRLFFELKEFRSTFKIPSSIFILEFHFSQKSFRLYPRAWEHGFEN
jgi:hypothetical protein